MTNFRTVPSASDGLPLLSAEYLVGHLGTSPTITFPAVSGQLPDVAPTWRYLAETAGFFAAPMPTLDEVRAACELSLGAVAARLVAVNVTVVEVDGAARAVVTADPVQLVRPEPVRLDVCDDVSPLPRPEDPVWQRMAGRTTSRAAEDRLARWLHDRGCVDGTGDDGVPFLGALVFDVEGRFHGVDRPEPTSVLDQLRHCGALVGVTRVARPPVDAAAAWWISPRFEIHPVSAIGPTAYRVDGAPPTFARSR